MKNNMSSFAIFLVGLVLLPGCMRVPLYKRKPLRCISNDCPYRGVEKNVIVRAKVLSQDEKEYLFDNHLTYENELHAIYVAIHNMSNRSYVFSCDNVSLKQISYHNVIKLIKQTSSFARLALSGVSGGYVASGFIFGELSSIYLSQGEGILPIVLFPIVVGFIAVSFFSLAQGIKSIVMNSRIKNDIKEKVLQEPVVISSGGQYEVLVFVKYSDYIPQFTITMHEKNVVENNITFDINLRQN